MMEDKEKEWAEKLEFGVFLAPPLGWCAAQRIKIAMIAGGNHTTIHAVTALAVTERALSAPYGGTSPKGRGKRGCLTNSNFPTSPTNRAHYLERKKLPWKSVLQSLLISPGS